MYTYDDDGERRALLSVQVCDLEGASLGWVTPDDWHAFINGDIDEAGIRRLAALQPEPPAGAEYVGPSPRSFVVRREDD